MIFENSTTIKRGVSLLLERSPSQSKVQIGLITLIFGIVLLEAIVYGYFHREIFSACFGAAAMWPWIQDAGVAYNNVRLSLLWAILCMILASFTVLPVVKQESISQIVIAGILMFTIGLYCTVELGQKLKLRATSLTISGVQVGLIALSVIVTRSSIISLQAREGLPIGNQVTGWIVMIASFLVPFLHTLNRPISDYRFRLLTIFMAFSPTFVVLTISYEGLFYVSFYSILMVWIELEHLFYSSATHKSSNDKRELSIGDFRLSLFSFFLSQIGFFGTGNIASISSFSLDSVYRLIPIFDPFSMGALLMFKILVPFAVLSVMIGILNMKLGVPSSALFAMVMSISDILSLNFFYLVVDEGSWLDIGTGISHFCISSCLCLFMIGLEYLSGILVSGVEDTEETTEQEKSTKPILAN